VHVCPGGAPADVDFLNRNFRCRMVLFGYQNLAKDPLAGMREYVSVAIEPSYEKDRPNGWEKFSLTRALRSQDAGASEIEMGVGLAILLERTTAGDLEVAAGSRAWLQFDDIEISFTPRPRNDDVKV